MKASEDIQRQAANALDILSAITLALSVRRVIADGCTLTDAELKAIISAVSKAVESVKRVISLSTAGPPVAPVPRVTAGFSRIGAIHPIPQVLRDFGFDPAAVFAEVGLSLELFANRDNLIANVDACRLLRVCADLTRCDHFGLLVGDKSSLPSLGFVGLLASHSPDVGTALRSINRYLTLNNGAAIATLSEHGAHAIWGYAIYQRGLVDSRHLCQVASAVACNVLRALCGPHWMPDEVLLPFRRPRDTRAFRDVYRSPVRFDADHVNVVFGRSWLSRAICGGDANVYATLTRQAVRLDAQAMRTLPDVVRQVTRRLLLAGDVSIDHVALTLSIHRRTLHRKLCAHGMEFRRLADEVRFEVAQELLRDTAMSVSDVATALRYSSASAFATAFRRWSANTPSDWRALNN